MNKKRDLNIHKHIRPQGTYEDGNAWVTSLGEYNIVHYDCPTDEEIRQRVKDVTEEVLGKAVEEPDCLLYYKLAILSQATLYEGGKKPELGTAL